jgi:hypothetical protein
MPSAAPATTYHGFGLAGTSTLRTQNDESRFDRSTASRIAYLTAESLAGNSTNDKAITAASY